MVAKLQQWSATMLLEDPTLRYTFQQCGFTPDQFEGFLGVETWALIFGDSPVLADSVIPLQVRNLVNYQLRTCEVVTTEYATEIEEVKNMLLQHLPGLRKQRTGLGAQPY